MRRFSSAPFTVATRTVPIRGPPPTDAALLYITRPITCELSYEKTVTEGWKDMKKTDAMARVHAMQQWGRFSPLRSGVTHTVQALVESAVRAHASLEPTPQDGLGSLGILLDVLGQIVAECTGEKGALLEGFQVGVEGALAQAGFDRKACAVSLMELIARLAASRNGISEVPTLCRALVGSGILATKTTFPRMAAALKVILSQPWLRPYAKDLYENAFMQMPPHFFPLVWALYRRHGYDIDIALLDHLSKNLLNVSKDLVHHRYYDVKELCDIVSDVCDVALALANEENSPQVSAVVTRAVICLRHSGQWKPLCDVVNRLLATPHANRLFKLKAISAIAYCSHHLAHPSDIVVSTVEKCLPELVETSKDRKFLTFSDMNRQIFGDSLLMSTKILRHAKRNDVLFELYEQIPRGGNSVPWATVYFAQMLVDREDTFGALSQLHSLRTMNTEAWTAKGLPETVHVALYGVAELMGRNHSHEVILNFLTQDPYLADSPQQGPRERYRNLLIEKLIVAAAASRRHDIVVSVVKSAISLRLGITFHTQILAVRSSVLGEESTIEGIVSVIDGIAADTKSSADWGYDEVILAYLGAGRLNESIAFVKRFHSQTSKFSAVLGRLYSACAASEVHKEILPFLQNEMVRRGLSIQSLDTSTTSSVTRGGLSTFHSPVVTWQCAHCSTKNSSGDVCTSCNARRESLWNCPQCKFINAGQLTFCAVCDSLKPIHPVLTPSRHWTCQKCERENSHESPLVCAFCQLPNELGATLARVPCVCTQCLTKQPKGMLQPWCEKCGTLQPLAARHPKHLWECPRCANFNPWLALVCGRCHKVSADEGHRKVPWQVWQCPNPSCKASNHPTVAVCSCGRRRVSSKPLKSLGPTEEESEISVSQSVSKCKYCHAPAAQSSLALCDVCYCPQVMRTEFYLWVCLHQGCLTVNYSFSERCISCHLGPTHVITDTSKVHKELFTTTTALRVPLMGWGCHNCGAQNEPANLSMICSFCFAPHLSEEEGTSTPLHVLFFVRRACRILRSPNLAIGGDIVVLWARTLALALHRDSSAPISIWQTIGSSLPSGREEPSIPTVGSAFLADFNALIISMVRRHAAMSSHTDRVVMRHCVDAVCEVTAVSHDVLGFGVYQLLHESLLKDKAQTTKLRVNYLVNMKLGRTDIVVPTSQRCTHCLGAHRQSMCPELLVHQWSCTWCAHFNSPEGLHQYICRGCFRFRADCLHRDTLHRTWECAQCHRWNLHLHSVCVFCDSVPRLGQPMDSFPCSPMGCSVCRTVHLEPTCPLCTKPAQRPPESLVAWETEPQEDQGVVIFCASTECKVRSGTYGYDVVVPKRVALDSKVGWPLKEGLLVSFVLQRGTTCAQRIEV